MSQRLLDWQTSLAPGVQLASSPHEYMPIGRVDGAQLPFAHMGEAVSTVRFLKKTAGLFEADGYVGLVTPAGRNHTKLIACITQPSCPELLAAIQSRLGYGTLQNHGAVLEFRGPAVIRFWEDVVHPYGVAKLHRYATYLLLACRGGTKIRNADLRPPCAYHSDGGRFSQHVEGAAELR